MNASATAGFAAQRALIPALYGGGIPALSALRERAHAAFLERGVPTSGEDEWRYADLEVLTQTPHEVAHAVGLAGSRERALLEYLLGGFAPGRMVFVNGAYAPAVSEPATHAAGITFQPLAAAAALHGELVTRHLGKSLAAELHPLAALNTALHRDGLFLHCAGTQRPEAPFHGAFLAAGDDKPRAIHPRALVVLEEGAAATLILSFQGSGQVFVNPAVEVTLGRDAVLNLILLQEESSATTHTLALHASLASGAHCHVHAASLGGRFARTEVHAHLADRHAEFQLDALLIGGHEQAHDLTARIHHDARDTKSRQALKAVLDGSSRGAFSGRVEVSPGADGTHAEQSCRSLILSPDAAMNTRPELVIHADDVRCAHGATYGQLDPEALFYLRSRGIDLPEARRLLTRAFADEIIDRFPLESVRRHLHARVDGRIARPDETGVPA